MELKKKESTQADPMFMVILDGQLDMMKRTRVQAANEMTHSKRRLLKSHNPFSLLPPDLLSRNKVFVFSLFKLTNYILHISCH